MKTEFSGKITWLGRVPEDTGNVRSTGIPQIDARYDGFGGERHAGMTRASCVRVKDMHAQGTDIRNVRQFSIVSAEELAMIAAGCGLDVIRPEWLGASMVVEGIADFTHLPPSARLQSPAGTTLVIDMQNRPCQFPAKEIEADHPGHGKRFLPAARGRRGVTAWVEREGPLVLGDVLTLHIPDQRNWHLLEPTLSADAREI